MSGPPPTPKGSPPPDGILARVFYGGLVSNLRRFSRWFNLTMVQQGVWPLLLLLTTAPAVDVRDTPTGWFALRVAAPCVAAMMAAFFISRSTASHATKPEVPSSMLATQARYVIIGVSIAVAIARLVAGPVDESLKLILFGLASVAAYHLIHFGIVPRSFPDVIHPNLLPVVLFGLSWGVHDLLLVSSGEGVWYLAFLAGCVLGWLTALVLVGLRRWPGGAFTAAAAHFTVIYLTLGFL